MLKQAPLNSPTASHPSIGRFSPHPIQLHDPEEVKEGVDEANMPFYVTKEIDDTEEDQPERNL